MAKESATGLKKETAGALAYVLGPVTGIIFLVLEKDSFVRFHAMQSIVFSVGLFVINTLLGLTVILVPILPIFFVLEFVVWLLLVYKASQGEKFEVPYLSKFVRQLLGNK